MSVVELTKSAEPDILLDKDNFYFKASGVSYPEDAVLSYAPLIEWLNAIDISLKPSLKGVFDFQFLNSVSSKMIYEVLIKMRSFHLAGLPVKVEWYHDESDEDIQELGDDLARQLKIPMEIIGKEEEN